MICEVCKIEFQASRKDAKLCSARCRKIASRINSVTDNVTLSAPHVTDNFEFIVKSKHDEAHDIATAKKQKRSAKYWYDVPLGALPILQKGWPKMPDYMNGRQYFLWWKNDFKTEPDGTPIIHNPFPERGNLTYVQAGEGSRRWGA